MPKLDIRHATTISCCIVAACVGVSSCTRAPETAFARLTEARRLAAALLIAFSKSVDAGNRAVMADTDQTSIEFAKEAEQASAEVERDAEALAPVLRDLGYGAESALLAEAKARFGKYRALDRTVLQLAVENTNLKAQQLSFGPASAAADDFRDALAALAKAARPADAWHAQALAASAVAAVREIQAAHARHIAEPDDANMTRMEQQMAESESAARETLRELSELVGSGASSQVAAASGALDRFMSVHSQIVALSRRNTNVRSLALALGQKRALSSACEDSLRALQTALSKRGFLGNR